MEKRKKSKVVCKLIDAGMGSWNDDLSPPEQLCFFSPQNCFQNEAKSSFKFPPPPVVAVGANHGSWSSNRSNRSSRQANVGVFEQPESDSSHCYTTGSMSDVEDNSDSQSECGKAPLPNMANIPVSGSHSDTGFGIMRTKSTPISIRRCAPRCSMRGYESDGSPITAMRNAPRLLPPIGVFWDIENCQVPKGRSAVAVAQVIRDRFFEGFREAEFLVVCDVKKENSQVIQELNDAQVNLIHVASTCKNAADEKLRQSIRRFAEIYGNPAAIVLISGDVNFAADLCDLRHRKKIHVILVHNNNTSDTLIVCANDHYNFSTLVESLPLRGVVKSCNQAVEVLVSNLPSDKEATRIKNRLKKLSDNCGGRVGTISRDSALIRFPTYEFAVRAQKRMDGEDVFGNKITVSRPMRVVVRDQDSPYKQLSEHQSRARLNTYHDDSNQSISSYQFGSSYSKMVRNNGTGLEMASGGASQFGQPPIGSPGFYRSVPPPVFNARTSVAPIQNGWTRTTKQTQSLPHYSNASSLKQIESNGVFSPSTPPTLQPWQTSDTSFPGATPLDIASQSLSMLTASLSNFQTSQAAVGNNRGVGDFNLEGTQRVSGIRKAQGDSVLWDDSTPQSNFESKSRLGVNAFPSSRGASPTSRPSTSRPPPPPPPEAGSQSCVIPGRYGAGDSFLLAQTENGAREPKSRTPSPYSLASDMTPAAGRQLWNRTSPYSDEGKDSDRYFHPISVPGGLISINQSGRTSSQGQASMPVDLQVTNLDQNMDAKEIKKMLFQVFREHVMVLHVSVFIQPDGNYVATVKVPSLQDAQFAVSQLHRKKVGFKRIQISYIQAAPSMNPTLMRSQIISLLQEVPGHSLPLFKFRELFESRYLVSISVADMYKLRDVCVVSDDPSGRMVSLNPKLRNTPSPLFPATQDGLGQMPYELPYCAQHFRKSDAESKGWAEQEPTALPNVRIGLKVLANRIHGLLQTHCGRLPLPSLVYCYEAQYQQLDIDEAGVPLEHLVSCLPGIEIYQGVASVKYLRWAVKSEDSSHEDSTGSVSCVSPPLAGQLALFSRELVDLLKTTPNCQLSFNRFIPAYHHHFGRQCRVADYGFTKLIQLLEALPHIVQVLGEGSKRIVTLSHRAQVRRFTSDLLRVLKSQYSKQVTVSEFAAAYQRVLNRPFEVVSYGVCQLEDLLSEVSENTVLVTQTSEDILIAIPKREQTPDEIEKTKVFAQEVLTLLQYAPQCSMNFSKFIPYYHHHFGRQCRVADYGFTKLIELFEAIPHVVKITEDDEGERKVRLTLEQRLKVLGMQMAAVVESCDHQVVPLNVATASFLRIYGYALRPQDFDCNSMTELLGLIRHVVRVFNVSGKAHVALVDKQQLQVLGLLVRRVLWERPDCSMAASEFVQVLERCGQVVHLASLEKDLPGVVQVSYSEGLISSVRLTPLQVLGRNVYNLLCSDGSIPLATFEARYAQRFGMPIEPAQFGFTSVKELLTAIPDIVTLQRNTLLLNDQLSKLRIPEINGTMTWPSHGNGIPSSSTANDMKTRSNQPNSPDTVLKKLIRNIRNQPSPSKRVCGETNAFGYRPFGFGTSQQPLHGLHGVASLHGERFSWGLHDSSAFPPAPAMASPPVLSPPLGCPFPSPPRVFSADAVPIGQVPPGQEAALPGRGAALNDVPLPLVVPPDPSELPMPHLTLVSPPNWSSTNSTLDSQETRTGELAKEMSTSASSVGTSERSSTPHGNSSEPDCNTSLDANTSSASLKRKQRLAIQFNSPLIPIQ